MPYIDTYTLTPSYMGMTCSPLPINNDNSTLPFFGGNYSIFLLDNIHQ